MRALKTLLGDLSAVPESIRTAVRNNGGGHYNHTMFWMVMSPGGGGEPSGPLSDALNSTFGSFAEFVKAFSNAAADTFRQWLAPGWYSISPANYLL